MNILFITRQEIITIHFRAIKDFGGLDGILNESMLESAINMPQLGTKEDGYFHKTIPEMAAAYGYYLSRNHPFRDGNKRTALAAVGVFLRMNGYEIPDSDEFCEAIENVASGKITKEEFTEFIRGEAILSPVES